MSPLRFTLLGYKLGLAQPLFLALVPLAFVLGLIVIFLAFRRTHALTRVIPARLAEVLAPGVSTALPVTQRMLQTTALVFFAIALAQPQCGEKAEVVKRRGIDVVVAIDASKSMLARDVAPSRLERARLELSTLLDQLKGDRVAVVAFAGDAFIQCPLTSDYGAARIFLRAIDPNQMPQGGTNIGSALLLARQVFDNADRGSKDKVIVLLSDGEDLTGAIDEGVDSLKEIGAKVLAIGIGSEQGEPIPVISERGEVVGYKKDENGVTVITRLDSAGLKRISSDTGGDYFSSPKSVAIADAVAVIDKLQKAELESRLTMKYGEIYQPFLAIGLLFLMLSMVLVPSWRWAR